MISFFTPSATPGGSGLAAVGLLSGLQLGVKNQALVPALQAQTKTATIPTTSKKASSAQGYATGVALATGWRGRKEVK